MNKGKKVRIIAIIVLVALIVTTEYRTLYEVAMASPLVQTVLGNSVSDNSQGEMTENSDDGSTQGTSGENPGENEGTSTEKNMEDNTEKNTEENTEQNVADTPVDGGVDLQGDSSSTEEMTEGEDTQGNASEESESESDSLFEEGEESAETEETLSANTLEELDKAEAAYGESEIPTEIDTFVEKYAASKEIAITTLQDWLNVQTISQKMDLSDYTFVINNNQTADSTGSNVFDLTTVGDFVGLGNESFPFKGTFTCFLSSGISIKTKVPIFKYLSAGSDVKRLNVICTDSVAGVAQYVVGEGQVSLSNITISGTITNYNGAAGGLFAHMTNQTATPLTVNVTQEENVGVQIGISNSQAQITGCYAGAIVGCTEGNVEFTYDSKLYDITNVGGVKGVDGKASDSSGTGLLFGLVKGNETNKAKIILTNTTTDTTTGESASAVEFSLNKKLSKGAQKGGLIGVMENGVLDTAGKTVRITGAANASYMDVYAENNSGTDGGVGGMIGVFKDSAITENSKFEIQHLYVLNTTRMKGLGGVFGIIYNCDIPSSVSFILNDMYVHTSSGVDSVGGFCGYYYQDNGKAQVISNVCATFLKVQSSGDSNKITYTLGGLIGLYDGAKSSKLTLSNWSIQGAFITSHYGSGTGGVVGTSMSDATSGLVIGKGTMDTSHSNLSSKTSTYNTTSDNKGSFMIWDSYRTVGGILGVLKTGNCTISDITAPYLVLRSDLTSGGVVGQVGQITGDESKKYLCLQNIEIGMLNQYCNSTNTHGIKGLLIGKAGEGSLVQLDGTMDFSNTQWYFTYNGLNQPDYLYKATNRSDSATYIGKIAGVQEKAVIYIDKDCKYNEYAFVSNGSNDLLKVKYVDEIGNFGAAYRNDTWGESQNVFDGSSINKGTITTDDGAYQLATVADLMRLAIALNSEGAFGTECFGEGVTYETLMASKYVLTGTSYDLTNTGIVSLQRTIGVGATDTSANISAELAKMPALFTGSFGGNNASNPAVITLDVSVYRQDNQGLFVNVGSNDTGTTAEFKNLKLVENLTQLESPPISSEYTTKSINKTGSMGGLSTYAQGNIKVSDCVLDVNMTSQEYYLAGDTDKTYYGGLFGQYVALDGSSLVINGLKAGGTKLVQDNDHYVSQVIACVESPVEPSNQPKIQMENIAVSGNLKNTTAKETSYLGGLIAVMNENQADGTDEKGWDNNASKEILHQENDKRIGLTIDGLTISGLTLKNSPSAYRSSGLLGFRWLDTEAQISNLKVGTADAQNTLATNSRFGGLLNEMSGKLELKTATISYTTITNTQSIIANYDYLGLVVAEASYLYLSVVDYTVDSSTIIKLAKKKNFDEIAGTSIKHSGDSFTNSEGGVVSISKSDVTKSLDVSSDGTYKGYQNTATYYVGYKVAEDGTETEGTPTDGDEFENEATRYYYDLERILSADNAGDLYDNGNYLISTPEELIRWHLVHYARSELREYFLTDAENDYGTTTAISLIRHHAYKIEGTIDLNGYSYYPTTMSEQTITGINNATIKFYAQDIADKEALTDKRYPYEDKKQHYLLHAGLFYNVEAANISNLTLTGTVAGNSSKRSGGLICGTLSGVAAGEEDEKLGYMYSTQTEDYTTIQGITLNNLWVSKATKGDNSWDGNGYGLMVSEIKNGAKVNMSEIRMTGYTAPTSDTDYSNTPSKDNKAARALIGVVGTTNDEPSETVCEIQLNFIDMDIADLADDVDVSDTDALPADLKNSNASDKVLQAASLICYYNYYEDSCFGIYTFTKADYLSGKGITASADGDTDAVNIAEGSGYITMGNEINEDTEYIDPELTTKILSDKYGFNNKNYKPYVYSVRQILVNPKPGHITEGCGTYEDPYIIRTDKQLKSLYYYLKNQTAQILNWQINEIGDDTTFCKKTNASTNDSTSDENTDTSIHTIKTYGTDTDFPTREQLNQAYYVIDPNADTNGNRKIDLSTCSDYTGLGSLQEPFVGVIIGKTDDNGYPVIQLPGYVNEGNDVDSYGLIRYGKGCVVKDLVIELTENTKTETDTSTNTTTVTYRPTVKTAGAGVIATVCGGDNVIDNVTVKGMLQAAEIEEGQSTPTVNIGGYVGCVDLGSVILRNITGESLNTFVIADNNGTTLADNDSYMWIGGIIGRVKDGVVVYEGLGESTKDIPVIGSGETTSGFAYANASGLKASPNFGILNEAYLTASGSVKLTPVIDSTTSTMTSVTIQAENLGQLLLLSHALNSGALTYKGDTEANLGYRNGYGADSRCRNGAYSTVGAAADSTDSAYQDAIKYDNLNGGQSTTDGSFFAPYLMNYFSTSSGVLASQLLFQMESCVYNSPDTYSSYLDMQANQLTLQFAENGTYDMTVFGNSFRGIGSGYYKEQTNFKGNVDGNNSSVVLSYISNDSLAIENIGLFNTVTINSQSDGCYMKDLTISGDVINVDATAVVGNKLEDTQLAQNSSSGRGGAGLIGRLEMDCSLDASGFTSTYNYLFENIQIKNLNVQTREYAGGIIGRIASTPEGGANDAYENVLYFKDCIVGSSPQTTTTSTGETKYEITLRASADVGGIIASYQDKIDVTMENCTVQSVDLQALGMHCFSLLSSAGEWENKTVYPSAGGFIGRGVGKNKTITVLGGSYDTINLKSKGHMGGVIGQTESTLLVNSENSGNKFTGTNIKFYGNGTSTEAATPLFDVDIETTKTTNNVIISTGADYHRTKYLGSFGGLVGFVSGPATHIYSVDITNIDGSITNGRQDRTFMGGLIGRLYETHYSTTGNKFVIQDCHIGSETTSLKLESTSNGSSSNRVSVGGLAGNIECLADTYIIDCEVIGDANQTSVLQGTDTAGGMTGSVLTYEVVGTQNTGNTKTDIYYQNCKVQNLNIKGYARVGGVEGKRLVSSNWSSLEVFSRFYNVHVSSCLLENMTVNGFTVYKDDSAVVTGGLQGQTQGHTIVVSSSVKDVHMKGETAYAAGGLVGRASGQFGWVRVADTEVSGCTIAGARVGGIAGVVDKNKTTASNMPVASKVTVKQNKIISHFTDAKGDTQIIQYAGGLYGLWSNYQERIVGDNIEIRDNIIGALPIDSTKIASTVYVGGIAGTTRSKSHLMTVKLSNNIVSILDKEEINNKLTEDTTLEDYLISDDFGIWKSEDGSVSGNQVDRSLVQSIAPVMYLYDSSTSSGVYEEYKTFKSEADLKSGSKSYLGNVGLMFGSNGKTENPYNVPAVRVADAQVHYDDDLSVYRPAADVAGENIHQDTWSYHIMYGKYDDSVTNETEIEDNQTAETETVDNQSIPNALGVTGYYQFGDLQKIVSDYLDENNNKYADRKYAYRLADNYLGTNSKTNNPVEDILTTAYYDFESVSDEGYRSIYKNNEGKVIPMLVYNPKDTLDETVNTAISALTNVGGSLLETNINNTHTTNVTAYKMVVKDGVVTKDETMSPSITVNKMTPDRYTLAVNSAGYDVQTDEKNGTFTVLHIEYTWQYSSGMNSLTYTEDYTKYETTQTQTMCLDIPIYIEKVLEYQSHITGVQGTEYSVENLLTNGKTEIQTLRSTYTAYVEYDYNDAYDKYNLAMTKEIVFKDPTTADSKLIPQGTKFVLIDVTNQNHAYYYKVDTATYNVELASFADSANVKYTEPNISTLTGMTDMSSTLYTNHEMDDSYMASEKYALQQYILLVDSSEIAGVAENYAYNLEIQPMEEENAILLRRSIEKPCQQTNCNLTITEYQGLAGAFDKDNTKIEGEISQESDVHMELNYAITAPDAYWNYIKANKDSTIPQYLDVAIYLERDQTRVALPTGTQVIFNKGTNEQVVGVVQGNTILYQNKDSGKIYDLNALTGNVTISATIDLDFSGADFAGFGNGEYTIHFDLLKTKDPNYPMGGQVLDSYSTQIKSTAKKSLGFALQTKDLLTLGMNGYLPEESDSGIIDYDMKIDFSDYVDSLGFVSSELDVLAGKYFTVVYEVQKKVKDGTTGELSYVPYEGDLVKVYFGDSSTSFTEDSNGSQVVYKFTKDYMKKGNGEDKAVVTFPYTVVADVQELLKANDQITNYRVVGKLYLSDSKPTGAADTQAAEDTEGCAIYISPNATISDEADGMEDFFVFTVAKIKTDLDITR